MRAKERIKEIAKSHQVRLKFIKTGHPCYDFKTKTISLPLDLSDQRLIFAFFHELAHFENQKNNKFPLYHNNSFPTIMKKFKNSYWKTTAYVHRAELYTDKVGEKLCNQFFPGLIFWGGYSHDPKGSLGFIQRYYFQYNKNP